MRLASHQVTIKLCRVMHLWAFAFLLVWGLSGLALANLISTPLSSHVLNVILSGAGAGSNWPTTTNELSAITSAVSRTVCDGLPDGASNCRAFLIRESETTLALQLSTNTLTAAAGNSTYSLLSTWASNGGTTMAGVLTRLIAACEEALSTSLNTVTFSSGKYTMPCRGGQTYSYLPVCDNAEVPVTTAYILEPSGDVKNYFSAYLCKPTDPATCRQSIVVLPPSASSQYTVVTITGLSNGLEAVLAFVAAVRADFVGAPQAINPGIEIPSAGFFVREVQIRYGGMRAVLFSTNENKRTHSETSTVNITCQPSAAYWALSLIGILPLCGIICFCSWHRGRRKAKKQERRRVVADETRIIQGFTNPDDIQGAEKGPPPGFDASITAGIRNTEPRWVTDANGYYYDLNTTAQADAESYETYVDPNTNTKYRYITHNVTGTGDVVASQELQQPGHTTEMNVVHHTSLELDTGGTRKPTADISGAERNEDQAAEAPVTDHAGDTADSGGYQTYVDPNTGETYQYTTEEPDAVVSGYQYVDPVTGETYQYVDLPDGNEMDQGYDEATASNVYVDPNTGEMYRYETLQQ